MWLLGYATQAVTRVHAAMSTQEVSSSDVATQAAPSAESEAPDAAQSPDMQRTYVMLDGVQQLVTYVRPSSVTNKIHVTYGAFPDTNTAHDVFVFVTTEATVIFAPDKNLEQQLVFLPDEVLFPDGGLIFRQGSFCVLVGYLGSSPDEGMDDLLACANAILSRINAISNQQ